MLFIGRGDNGKDFSTESERSQDRDASATGRTLRREEMKGHESDSISHVLFRTISQSVS